MICYHKEYRRLPCGQTRVVRRFLLFPKRLGYVTRWLEWAYIRQIAPCGVIGKHGNWDDYEWVNDTNWIQESEKGLENR